MHWEYLITDADVTARTAHRAAGFKSVLALAVIVMLTSCSSPHTEKTLHGETVGPIHGPGWESLGIQYRLQGRRNDVALDENAHDLVAKYAQQAIKQHFETIIVMAVLPDEHVTVNKVFSRDLRTNGWLETTRKR